MKRAVLWWSLVFFTIPISLSQMVFRPDQAQSKTPKFKFSCQKKEVGIGCVVQFDTIPTTHTIFYISSSNGEYIELLVAPGKKENSFSFPVINVPKQGIKIVVKAEAKKGGKTLFSKPIVWR